MTWEVVGHQVGQRYPVMDLGQDSSVLSFHCHLSFCSKSMFADENVFNFFRTVGSSFPPQDLRTFPVEPSGSRYHGTSQEDSRGRFRRSVWQMHTRRPTSALNVSGLFPLQPNTFLAETPLSNAVPRSSGTLRQLNKLSQPAITRMGNCSSFRALGNTSTPITT